jgi:hypothetical protein
LAARLCRKKDELLIVQVRPPHPAGSPAGTGLLDALLGRGHEVPIDVARFVGLAAQRHDHRFDQMPDRHGFAGPSTAMIPCGRRRCRGDHATLRERHDARPTSKASASRQLFDVHCFGLW